MKPPQRYGALAMPIGGKIFQMTAIQQLRHHHRVTHTLMMRTEAQGRLPSDADIYELTNAASMGKPIGKAYIAALQAQYTELFPVNITVTDRANTEVVYASAGDRHTGTTVLREFASKVQKMRLLQYDLSVEGVGMAERNLPSAIGASMSGVRDPLGGAAVVPQRSSPLVAPCFLSMEQYEILHHVLTHAITDNEQALTMVHADELAMRNFRLISTCPTGAGAVHMRNGRTFASALRTHIKDDLGPQQVAEMRLIFDKNVAVIVVDEVSMFSGENLSLLDRRLRQLYSPSKVFGGMSVLLVGDFLQLRVIGGVDLYKVMYVARNAVEVQERACDAQLPPHQYVSHRCWRHFNFTCISLLGNWQLLTGDSLYDSHGDSLYIDCLVGTSLRCATSASSVRVPPVLAPSTCAMAAHLRLRCGHTSKMTLDHSRWLRCV